MATTLALRFLSSFLFFFFMNGHGIGARDMKVELGDQKEVDSHKVTPVSTDEAYITSYKTTLDYTQPKPYLTRYQTSSANEANQPDYLDGYIGYKTSTHSSKSNQPDYLDGYIGYKTSTHSSKSNQPNYLDGYKTRTHGSKSNQPDYLNGYIGYKTSTHDSKSNQPNYLDGYIGYKTSTHGSKSNQPDYLDGYIRYKTSTPSFKFDQPDYLNGYIGYKTSTHDSKSNQPYITGYRTPLAHEVDQPHTAGHKLITHDTNQHAFAGKDDQKEIDHDTNEPYMTQYGGSGLNKEPSKDSGEPYITQYGGSGPSKDPKKSATAQDSTKPYLTSYGLHPKKDSKESATQDSNEPYITQYGDCDHKQIPKESAHDHQKPYITQFGDHHHKQTPKQSAQDHEKPYLTQYRNHDHKQIQKESKGGVPSSNLDHTEAFKTGFFALEDLYVGNTMTLQFPVPELSHFLPRKEADSIPFSTLQLPSVLELFSVPDGSPQAKSMRATLELCEAETITGETKTCANSLESMLEFVSNIIGSEDKSNILTTSHPTPSAEPLQKYTILEVSQDIYAPKWVACHPVNYPYAVHYCHFIATGTKVFKVLLSGENGDKMEALGVCHLDTSDWSPDHIIFRQLGFKAGKAPVCHFFPVKHFMWVPQPSKATM